jgi:hypothetical protein
MTNGCGILLYQAHEVKKKMLGWGKGSDQGKMRENAAKGGENVTQPENK